MATKKRRRFAEGGVAEDKESGLKASKGEKVGFFERLRMGNIDDEGSEAYRRFGAGRGKAERTPVETMEPSFVRQSAAEMPEMDEMEAANAREPIAVPAGPRAEKRVNAQVTKASAPAKASPKMQEQTYRRTSGDSGDREQTYRRTSGDSGERVKPDTSNYSNEGRGKSVTKPLIDQIPKDKSTVTEDKRTSGVSGSELGRNIANTALALGPGRLAGAVRAPVEFARASRVQDAFNKAATAGRTAEMRANADVTKLVSKPKATQKNPAKTTKKFDDEQSNVEFKRGGKVKKPTTPIKKMASGGVTSSASSRGDGIALRGKTRGRIY